MELVHQAQGIELIADGVDAVGDDQDRPIVVLGDEVAQQPADGAGQAGALAALAHQGELAVDARDGAGVAAGHQGAGLLDGHVVDAVAVGVSQVDDARQGTAWCMDLPSRVVRGRGGRL